MQETPDYRHYHSRFGQDPEPYEAETFEPVEDTDIEDLKVGFEAIESKIRPDTRTVLNKIITAFENYYDPDREEWVELLDEVRSVLDSFDTPDQAEVEEIELELSESGKLNALLTKATRLSPKERTM